MAEGRARMIERELTPAQLAGHASEAMSHLPHEIASEGQDFRRTFAYRGFIINMSEALTLVACIRPGEFEIGSDVEAFFTSLTPRFLRNSHLLQNGKETACLAYERQMTLEEVAQLIDRFWEALSGGQISAEPNAGETPAEQ